jgi:hypothetical protein
VRVRDENRDRAGRFANYEIHDRLCVFELHEAILRARLDCFRARTHVKVIRLGGEWRSPQIPTSLGVSRA